MNMRKMSGVLLVSLALSSACDAADKNTEKSMQEAPVKPSVVSKTAIASGAMIHDAEFYVLQAQNGEKWALEDSELDKKLAGLKKKYGQPPNIIHIMWDDTAFGDVGIPAVQKIRGFETPNINKMAEEGILFTRMYTEVGCVHLAVLL